MLDPDPQQTLNCRGKILRLNRPVIMGILNMTPDSFSDDGQFNNLEAAVAQVEKMVEEGAKIIDIGGYSSRPGAADVSEAEETRRIIEITNYLVERQAEVFISIDTFRSGVARTALEAGAHIINDISAGTADPEMFATVAAFDAPIVLMHMQGTPATMQDNPQYDDVVEEVYSFLVQRIKAAQAAGIHDIVIDPGFGFGKTLAHNYELFRNLDKFRVLGRPLLVGISRKSMIYRLFDTQPTDVLELSTALHMQAVAAGAGILRVHDVRPAARVARLQHYIAHGTF